MKKYLTYIAIFFACIALLDFGWGKLFDYLSKNAKSGETQDLNALVYQLQPDILILGSSRAHHHYDDKMMTDILGVKVYNAGVDGNGIVSMYGLFKMLTARYLPKLIIYDVEPAFDICEYSDDDNNRRYLQLLKPYFHDNGVTEIFQSLGWQERIKNYSGFYRYDTDFLNVLKNYRSDTPVSQYRFAPINGEMSEYTESGKTGISKVDSLKLFYLDRIAEESSKLGIDIVFACSPKYGAGDGSEVFCPVKEICEKYDMMFWDYYSQNAFQKFEYFKEPMHLNEDGARSFTDTIINRIIDFQDAKITAN